MVSLLLFVFSLFVVRCCVSFVVSCASLFGFSWYVCCLLLLFGVVCCLLFVVRWELLLVLDGLLLYIVDGCCFLLMFVVEWRMFFVFVARRSSLFVVACRCPWFVVDVGV